MKLKEDLLAVKVAKVVGEGLNEHKKTECYEVVEAGEDAGVNIGDRIFLSGWSCEIVVQDEKLKIARKQQIVGWL